MLVQFSVENFKSFDDLTTWSLRATADARLPHHVVTNPKGKAGAQLGVLRGAAIYGANAAGKSNLVLAISFAQRLILNGTRGDERIAVQPFKLGDGKERPSRFEFIFRHNDVLYSYGFAATAHRIHEEWLFATTTTKETRLFERITNGENQVVAEFGGTFKRSTKRGFLNFVAEGTRPNQLLLTECFERNVEGVKPVIEWFGEALQIIRADHKYQDLFLDAHANKTFTGFLSEFLNVAATGVSSVKPERIPFDCDAFVESLDDGIRGPIEDNIGRLSNNDLLILTNNTSGRKIFLTRNEQGEVEALSLLTSHNNSQGQSIMFGLEEESEGTQRLFHLVPALFQLKNTSKVLIIDELERCLHPLLTRLFIQAALDCDDMSLRGQLLFTTHDTNLLDLDLLRRDEIWFVEKDANGVSHLASLAEWKLNGSKVRPDLDIEKGYLQGRFGAIPFFGDITKLLCEPELQDRSVTKATAKNGQLAPTKQAAGKLSDATRTKAVAK